MHMPSYLLLQNYPDEDVPEFRPAIVQLYKEGTRLALKILEIIGYALKPEVLI